MTDDGQVRRDPVAVAREELAAGRPWAARDRLAGCLAHRPADPEVLDLLGRAEAALGGPERAGRWWYLVDRDDEEATTAREAFAAARDGDPLRMIGDLRAHAPLKAWPPAVRARLQALADAAAARGERWTPGSKPSWRSSSAADDEGPWEWLVVAGVVLATVGVWVVGVVAILGFLFG